MTEFEHWMLFLVGLSTIVNSLSILVIAIYWRR
jgi:hypothetical protein